MRLYEFEGYELFCKKGISIPDYELASSPDEALEKVKRIGFPLVLKAQVLTGGRYLAGGVKVASSPEELGALAQQILTSPIRGWPVKCVLLARKAQVEREFYLGVTVDRYRGLPVVILSAEGGVSVNEIAKKHPEAVVSKRVSLTSGLSLSEAQKLAESVGFVGEEGSRVADIMLSLFSLFREQDALLAEINPLARTRGGDYLALDAKIEIDDSSVYRHPEINPALDERIPNPLERKAREIGVTYVELDGDIGIISSGAGLGMATVDIISQRFRPANFLETGGAITADLLYKVMDLVLQKKGLRAIFINLYGGINPIHEGAKGVVRYIKEHGVSIPIVAKALGNRQEETWEIFRSGGVHVVGGVSTEEGVEELARLLEGKGEHSS